MKKNKLTKAMLPLLLSASAVAGAQMATEAGVGGVDGNHNTSGSRALLWSQLGATPRGNGAPDQNFEASYDVYDSVAADDFVVSGYGWSIEEIETIGTTDGVASSVNVSFHADNAGSPNPTALAGCSYSSIPVTDTSGSLSITLPSACSIIGAGTYWVAIQVNQDAATNGQHFWSNTDTVAGNEAHWINPGDGFLSGCTTFQPAGTVCDVGGGAPAFDFLYDLSGTQLDAPVAAAPVPSLNWLGMGLMVLTLGLFGRRFMRKANNV